MKGLKPYCINLISMGYLLQYNGEYLLKNDVEVTEYTKDIHTVSKRALDGTFESEHANNFILLPILYLDGIIVLLENDLTPEHKDIVYNSWNIPGVYSSFDFDTVKAINFYDVDDLNMLDCLTHEGMLQLEKYYAAKENYNSAIILRDLRVEEEKELEGKV